jgi:hypothetical protein
MPSTPKYRKYWLPMANLDTLLLSACICRRRKKLGDEAYGRDTLHTGGSDRKKEGLDIPRPGCRFEFRVYPGRKPILH